MHRLFALLLIFSVTACMAENISEMPIMPEKLAASVNCRLGLQTGAVLINSQQKFENALKQVNSHQIQSSTMQMPMVNFINEHVLAISMGQQRTGGYSLGLTGQPLVVKGDEAQLTVNWKTPQPGMMTIQMLTSPCLLVKIPKGNYKNISVVTQKGKALGKLAI